MKNFRILLASMLLSISLTSSTFANDPTGTTSSDLRNRVLELVDNPTWDVSQDDMATIEFQLNAFGEIQVVNIYSDNSEIASFIESRLNNKDSEMMLFVPGQSYFIDVHFINES